MIVITGSKGLLGNAFVDFFNENNIKFYGATREDFDFTIKEEIEAFFKNRRVDFIIHCGAYSNVDKAEAEKDICFKTNVEGTNLMALKAKELNIPIMYISTDYVFDGNGYEPYSEDFKKNPISFYGKSKALGEDCIIENCKKYFIIRTSWLFGNNGIDFIDKIIKLSENKKEINVVSDQIGSPTYTKALVPMLYNILISEKYGTYNVTNENFCSWADFASFIVKELKLDIKINKVKSSEYNSKAKRPYNSRLSKNKIKDNGFGQLETWQQSLKEYLNQFYNGSDTK